MINTGILFDFSQHADNVCMIDETGKEMTYRQLSELSDSLSIFFKPGILVLCLCSNSFPSIGGYVACIQHRSPVILVDCKKDISEYLNIYQPNYIWAPIDDQKGLPLFTYGDYGLYPYSSEHIAIHEDLALLLTTSGSTGSPKLVRLTENNLSSNASSIAEYLDIDSAERAITSLPMHYSFGISVINSHFFKGATLLVTERSVIDREFWNFFRAHGGTSFAGVPYTYEMLKRFRFFRMNLDSLKTMIQAGGRLDPALVLEYAEFAKKEGKRFFVMYGQTEAAPRISYLPFNEVINRPSSIGVAIPGGCLSLEDKNGNPIQAAEQEGELVYKGENVCMGYATVQDDLRLGDENNGVLHTGDLAKRDENGFYYITGRLKRFVKIWGNRVNLDSMESLLKKDAIDCACVGSDNKIVIFVTTVGIEDDVVKFLSQKTGFHKSVFEIKVIPEIPKASSGKTLYSQLELLK